MFAHFLSLPSSPVEGQTSVTKNHNSNHHRSSTNAAIALNALNTTIMALIPHTRDKVFRKLVYQLLQVKTFVMTAGETEDELRSTIAALTLALDNVQKAIETLPDDATAKELKAKLRELKRP